MADRVKPARIVIIGAGLAGMATAYSLAAAGEPDVLLLEKEQMPGLHSSGRNAAMIRQVVSERSILPLARGGADFLRETASGWEDPPLWAVNGSLLTASGERWKKLKEEAAWTRKSGAHTELWNPQQVVEAVPAAAGGRFDGAVWCPSDGVTDAQQLLSGFFREARARGVRLLTGCQVQAIRGERGKVSSVETDLGRVGAEIVVNAGGPWAGLVGRMAGAQPVAFRPMRRHLYFTGPLDWSSPGWPFVWDVSNEVYFRPESKGLLLSPCDEFPAEPELPAVDPSVQDLLAEKLSKAFPHLLEAPIARSWAGLRTFAPDRHFVIGWDTVLEGFYWVAGLGGHGVTTSAAVGKMAAEEILRSGHSSDSPFAPARFV